MKKLRKVFGNVTSLSSVASAATAPVRKFSDKVNKARNVNDDDAARPAVVVGDHSLDVVSMRGMDMPISPAKMIDSSYRSYKSSSLDSLDPLPENSGMLEKFPCDLRIEAFFSKLHKTAYEGDVIKLRKYSKKISIGTIDEEGRTALHLSAAKGHVNAIHYLVMARADLNICDNRGFTPLMLAIRGGHAEAAVVLLEKEPVLEAKDENGNTALHYACMLPPSDAASVIVKKLLSVIGEKEARKCSNMKTHEISEDAANSEPELTGELASEGAELLEAVNSSGRTPLHLACLRDNLSVCTDLLDHHSSLNVSDKDGATPLMLAALSGDVQLIGCLLNYNADAFLRDVKGRPAAEYARMSGNDYALQMIVKACNVGDGEYSSYGRGGGDNISVYSFSSSANIPGYHSKIRQKLIPSGLLDNVSDDEKDEEFEKGRRESRVSGLLIFRDQKAGDSSQTEFPETKSEDDSWGEDSDASEKRTKVDLPKIFFKSSSSESLTDKFDSSENARNNASRKAISVDAIEDANKICRPKSRTDKVSSPGPPKPPRWHSSNLSLFSSDDTDRTLKSSSKYSRSEGSLLGSSCETVRKCSSDDQSSPGLRDLFSSSDGNEKLCRSALEEYDEQLLPIKAVGKQSLEKNEQNDAKSSSKCEVSDVKKGKEAGILKESLSESLTDTESVSLKLGHDDSNNKNMLGFNDMAFAEESGLSSICTTTHQNQDISSACKDMNDFNKSLDLVDGSSLDNDDDNIAENEFNGIFSSKKISDQKYPSSQSSVSEEFVQGDVPLATIKDQIPVLYLPDNQSSPNGDVVSHAPLSTDAQDNIDEIDINQSLLSSDTNINVDYNSTNNALLNLKLLTNESSPTPDAGKITDESLKKENNGAELTETNKEGDLTTFQHESAEDKHSNDSDTWSDPEFDVSEGSDLHFRRTKSAQEMRTYFGAHSESNSEGWDDQTLSDDSSSLAGDKEHVKTSTREEICSHQAKLAEDKSENMQRPEEHLSLPTSPSGTLGRRDTLLGTEEIWEQNAYIECTERTSEKHSPVSSQLFRLSLKGRCQSLNELKTNDKPRSDRVGRSRSAEDADHTPMHLDSSMNNFNVLKSKFDSVDSYVSENKNCLNEFTVQSSKEELVERDHCVRIEHHSFPIYKAYKFGGTFSDFNMERSLVNHLVKNQKLINKFLKEMLLENKVAEDEFHESNTTFYQYALQVSEKNSEMHDILQSIVKGNEELKTTVRELFMKALKRKTEDSQHTKTEGEECNLPSGALLHPETRCACYQSKVLAEKKCQATQSTNSEMGRRNVSCGTDTLLLKTSLLAACVQTSSTELFSKSVQTEMSTEIKYETAYSQTEFTAIEQIMSTISCQTDPKLTSVESATQYEFVDNMSDVQTCTENEENLRCSPVQTASASAQTSPITTGDACTETEAFTSRQLVSCALVQTDPTSCFSVTDETQTEVSMPQTTDNFAQTSLNVFLDKGVQSEQCGLESRGCQIGTGSRDVVEQDLLMNQHSQTDLGMNDFHPNQMSDAFTETLELQFLDNMSQTEQKICVNSSVQTLALLFCDNVNMPDLAWHKFRKLLKDNISIVRSCNANTNIYNQRMGKRLSKSLDYLDLQITKESEELSEHLNMLNLSNDSVFKALHSIPSLSNSCSSINENADLISTCSYPVVQMYENSSTLYKSPSRRVTFAQDLTRKQDDSMVATNKENELYGVKQIEKMLSKLQEVEEEALGRLFRAIEAQQLLQSSQTQTKYLESDVLRSRIENLFQFFSKAVNSLRSDLKQMNSLQLNRICLNIESLEASLKKTVIQNSCKLDNIASSCSKRHDTGMAALNDNFRIILNDLQARSNNHDEVNSSLKDLEMFLETKLEGFGFSLPSILNSTVKNVISEELGSFSSSVSSIVYNNLVETFDFSTLSEAQNSARALLQCVHELQENNVKLNEFVKTKTSENQLHMSEALEDNFRLLQKQIHEGHEYFLKKLTSIVIFLQRQESETRTIADMASKITKIHKEFNDTIASKAIGNHEGSVPEIISRNNTLPDVQVGSTNFAYCNESFNDCSEEENENDSAGMKGSSMNQTKSEEINDFVDMNDDILTVGTNVKFEDASNSVDMGISNANELPADYVENLKSEIDALSRVKEENESFISKQSREIEILQETVRKQLSELKMKNKMNNEVTLSKISETTALTKLKQLLIDSEKKLNEKHNEIVQLLTENCLLKEKSRKFQTELEILRKENAQISCSKTDNAKDANDYNIENELLEAKMRELEQQNDSLFKRVQFMDNMLNKNSKINVQLEEELRVCNNTISRLQEENGVLSSRKISEEQLQQTILNKSMQISESEARYSLVLNTIKDKDEEIISKHSFIRELQRKLEDMATKSSEVDAHVEILKTSLQQSEEKLQRQAQVFRDLSNSFEDMRNENENKDLLLQAKQEKINRLMHNNDELQQTIRKLKNCEADVNNQLNAKELILDEQSTKILELSQKLRAKSEEIQHFHSTVRKVKEEKMDLMVQVDELHKELAKNVLVEKEKLHANLLLAKSQEDYKELEKKLQEDFVPVSVLEVNKTEYEKMLISKDAEQLSKLHIVEMEFKEKLEKIMIQLKRSEEEQKKLRAKLSAKINMRSNLKAKSEQSTDKQKRSDEELKFKDAHSSSRSKNRQNFEQPTRGLQGPRVEQRPASRSVEVATQPAMPATNAVLFNSTPTRRSNVHAPWLYGHRSTDNDSDTDLDTGRRSFNRDTSGGSFYFTHSEALNRSINKAVEEATSPTLSAGARSSHSSKTTPTSYTHANLADSGIFESSTPYYLL